MTRQITLVPFIAIILFVLQTTLGVSLRHLDTVSVGLPLVKLAKWDPELFRAFTFGNWPAAVTGLWLRVMQEPGLAKLPRDTRAPIYFDLDLATDLDPAFFEAYVEGGLLLGIIRDDVYGARDLLVKAQRFRKDDMPAYPPRFRDKYWSQEWAVPLHLAYLELFELDNLPKASVYFKEAAEILGAPSYLKGLASKLETREGQYEVGIRLLNFMISGERDQLAVVKLTRKRDALFLGLFLYQIDEGFKTHLKTIKDYRLNHAITRAKMEIYWKSYVRAQRVPLMDPFGGKVGIDSNGHVTSTSLREKVLGFD